MKLLQLASLDMIRRLIYFILIFCSCKAHTYNYGVKDSTPDSAFELLAEKWKFDTLGHCRSIRNFSYAKQIVSYYERRVMDSEKIEIKLGKPDFRLRDVYNKAVTFKYSLYPICNPVGVYDSSYCVLNFVFGKVNSLSVVCD